MFRKLLALVLAALLLLPAAGGSESAEDPVPTSAEAGPGSAEALPAGLPRAFVYVQTTTEDPFFLPLPDREEDSYTYTLHQLHSDGSDAFNHIRVTPEGVWMESANCDNQDCVGQGTLTLANRELRPLGNFIICLPHRVWLSLYTTEEILAMYVQE